MRVLVADDDHTSRELLKCVVETLNVEIILAEDGQEAWEYLQSDLQIRLAILDQEMPFMSGKEVCQKVGTLSREVPVYTLIVTHIGEKEDVISSFQAGVDDYVTKPFSPGELIARIKVGMRMVALQESLNAKVLQYKEALEKVKLLEGILPICSFCKKIRDDSEYWQSVEQYVSEHSHAQFSHSVCPSCAQEHYGVSTEDSLESKSPNEG